MLRAETPASVARHPQGAANGQLKGLATGPEVPSPWGRKRPVRVSSVVVAVTLGQSLSRFRKAVGVYGYCIRLAPQCAYMTV